VDGTVSCDSSKDSSMMLALAGKSLTLLLQLLNCPTMACIHWQEMRIEMAPTIKHMLMGVLRRHCSAIHVAY
jgi:hypothetical protein